MCYQGDVDALLSFNYDSVKLDGCGKEVRDAIACEQGSVHAATAPPASHACSTT